MPLQPARMRPWMISLVRFLPALLLLCVFVLAPVQNATAQSAENDLAAVVNAEPITRQMLADAVVQRFGLDVMDNMVNRHLIMQECMTRGVEVTKEDVSQEINRMAGKYGLSLDSYLTLLKEERNISPSEYSTEMVWPMLALRRLVAEKIQITDEEFNKAYLSQFGEAVKCRMIMVSERQKALDLHARAVANPEQFGQLAKQFSEEESSASVGGLIPPMRRFNGDSRLEDAAFALESNGISDVMLLGNQWVFLQAVRRIPASNPSPQALPAIREQIKDRIRDQKMRVAANELFARLQEQAQVVTVLGDAEKMQQHPGAAAIINGQQLNISMIAEACLKRHGEEVLEGEINRKLLTQALRKANKKITSVEIEGEIQSAASSYGFAREDGTPDVEAWIESVTRDRGKTRDLYVADSVWPSVALAKLVEDEVQLTNQDLQEGFEASYGPRAEVLAIVLSDQRTAQKIWEMARDNPTDDFFGKLAAQYSVEPVSSSNLGKVPPIAKFSGQPTLEKEAFKMKPGELSGIIATGGRYILLRCQGFTEPVVSDPTAVREELIRDLTEKKTNQAMLAKIEQLRNDSEIENFFVADATP